MDLLYRTFAAKDLFDIAGEVTGFGHPRWAQTHEPATTTAEAISRLEVAGASLVGKSICDEMAYSLDGENPTYGTPLNPRAPERVPGGSSSGSASLTAIRLVDFALGTDTGGSVRIPASYCGIYGFRPTHGRVSMEGCLPLAPSFDTVGWFTRSADLLQSIGDVLLDGVGVTDAPKRVLIARDAFALADDEVGSALESKVQKLAEIVGGESVEVRISTGDLGQWADVFRTIQAYEIWREHGDWISREQPEYGPGVRERVAWAESVTEEQYRAAGRYRASIVAQIHDEIGSDGVIVLPTAPHPAPRRSLDKQDREAMRENTLALTSIAGLSGLPQVSIPAAVVDGGPVGLSIIGGPGADERILDLADRIPPR